MVFFFHFTDINRHRCHRPSPRGVWGNSCPHVREIGTREKWKCCDFIHLQRKALLTQILRVLTTVRLSVLPTRLRAVLPPPRPHPRPLSPPPAPPPPLRLLPPGVGLEQMLRNCSRVTRVVCIMLRVPPSVDYTFHGIIDDETFGAQSFFRFRKVRRSGESASPTRRWSQKNIHRFCKC